MDTDPAAASSQSQGVQTWSQTASDQRGSQETPDRGPGGLVLDEESKNQSMKAPLLLLLFCVSSPSWIPDIGAAPSGCMFVSTVQNRNAAY